MNAPTTNGDRLATLAGLRRQELQMLADALTLRADTLEKRDAYGDLAVAENMRALRRRVLDSAAAAGFTVHYGQVAAPREDEPAPRGPGSSRGTLRRFTLCDRSTHLAPIVHVDAAAREDTPDSLVLHGVETITAPGSAQGHAAGFRRAQEIAVQFGRDARENGGTLVFSHDWRVVAVETMT